MRSRTGNSLAHRAIGTIASTDFSGGWPFPRNFDLEIALDQADPRLKPGMAVQLTVVVDGFPDALTIPVQASFQRSGQTIAYVWAGSKFEERLIEVGRRSGDRILVKRFACRRSGGPEGSVGKGVNQSPMNHRRSIPWGALALIVFAVIGMMAFARRTSLSGTETKFQSLKFSAETWISRFRHRRIAR